MTTTKTKTVSSSKLPPNPFIHEILELASKQRSRAKKIEILQEYRNDALTSLFIWNFDDTVVSLLPEGDVPYKENEVPVGTDHTSLRREWKHLYNFVKGGNNALSGLRRETMFIQMLEGLHPEEAKVLCLIKDKNLQTKYKINYDVVREAYTDIQWGGRS
mgnify:CR=1 FL=1|jgi:hypothetical protein